MNRTEVHISAIVHATEDVEKIRAGFDRTLHSGLEFAVREAQGHHDNPILLLSSRLTGAGADSFVGRLVSAMPGEAIDEITERLDELLSGSGLHLRFDKQRMVGGALELDWHGAVRIRIYTPVYKKGDAEGLYMAMLRPQLD